MQSRGEECMMLQAKERLNSSLWANQHVRSFSVIVKSPMVRYSRPQTWVPSWLQNSTGLCLETNMDPNSSEIVVRFYLVAKFPMNIRNSSLAHRRKKNCQFLPRKIAENLNWAQLTHHIIFLHFHVIARKIYLKAEDISSLLIICFMLPTWMFDWVVIL